MRWPRMPDYGYIPRWPEDGEQFIHPEDVPIARQCIPGHRIIRRDRFDGKVYHCSYGGLKFRLRPCIWVRVKSEGIDVGDLVETTGVRMRRELFVGRVDNMQFVLHKGCILYTLRRGAVVVPGFYEARELRLLTNKLRVVPTNVKHPTPKWNGDGERLSGVDLN